MPTQKLDRSILEAAILGFESRKRQIDTRIAELRQMLNSGPTQAVATPQAPARKRKVSAAARRRMAIAQRKRWAKIRGESEPLAPATPEPPKAKRRISEEGMKRIIAATKKRWRLAKAAKAQPQLQRKPHPLGRRPLSRKPSPRKQPRGHPRQRRRGRLPRSDRRRHQLPPRLRPKLPDR